MFLLGEDIGHFGGAFGVTKGLLEEFGESRVMDTPISEEGFVGAAIGAAWMGERPVVELQFADFISCPFDAIVTVAAKTHWRSGARIPLVIRAPYGGGVRGGPFHSQCPEGWFIGQPGLKVVCPGSVEDAYGLLRAAVEQRAEFLSQSSGATPHVEEALVILAAGGLHPGSLPDAVRAVRELHESMHRHRMGRLRSLGFGDETAEAISELHTANFM